MDVKVIGIEDLKKKLKEIKELGDKTIMGGIGNDAIKLMTDRTLSGKDVDHVTFEKYSQYYKNISGKSDPPNLKVTGNMLGAMKASVVDPLTVIIRVSGADAYNVGMMHQAGKEGMPQRKWFGLVNEEDRNQISEKLKKLILAKIYKMWGK